MRTNQIHSLFAAFGLLALTSVAAAQDRPSGMLTTVEVRQLVQSGTPADSARLSAHFQALAQRYTAEAARHTSMAKSFTGNPNRNVGSGMSLHCRRLAELATESATTVRELADYHGKLAAGAAGTPPAGGGRFEAGAGAPEPTAKDLDALAAKASTPADHRALEEYFMTLAKRYTAEAADHEALAPLYVGTRIPQVGTNHQRLARLAREAAKEASAAADMHKQFATLPR
jgi:gamma-glutamyl:cysteine ligase YbdK (ATP-grasp superfamily)